MADTVGSSGLQNHTAPCFLALSAWYRPDSWISNSLLTLEPCVWYRHRHLSELPVRRSGLVCPRYLYCRYIGAFASPLIVYREAPSLPSASIEAAARFKHGIPAALDQDMKDEAQRMVNMTASSS